MHICRGSSRTVVCGAPALLCDRHKLESALDIAREGKDFDFDLVRSGSVAWGISPSSAYYSVCGPNKTITKACTEDHGGQRCQARLCYARTTREDEAHLGLTTRGESPIRRESQAVDTSEIALQAQGASRRPGRPYMNIASKVV